MPELGGNPPPPLEPRIFPQLNTNLDVGIYTNVMGVLTLGTLVEGKEVTNGIPQMDKRDVLGMALVGPMALIGGKEDITVTPPVTLGRQLVGYPILDAPLTLDIR
jgi:hypothetical protein